MYICYLCFVVVGGAWLESWYANMHEYFCYAFTPPFVALGLAESLGKAFDADVAACIVACAPFTPFYTDFIEICDDPPTPNHCYEPALFITLDIRYHQLSLWGYFSCFFDQISTEILKQTAVSGSFEAIARWRQGMRGNQKNSPGIGTLTNCRSMYLCSTCKHTIIITRFRDISGA